MVELRSFHWRRLSWHEHRLMSWKQCAMRSRDVSHYMVLLFPQDNAPTASCALLSQQRATHWKGMIWFHLRCPICSHFKILLFFSHLPDSFFYQTSDTKVDKEYFFLWFSLWSLHSELNADNNNPCQITYHVTIANCYFNIRLICPSIIQIPDLFVEIITVVMHTYFCCTHNMSSWGLSFLSWPIGDLCGLRRGWPFMCILKVKPNWNTLIGNKFFGNSGDGLSRSPWVSIRWIPVNFCDFIQEFTLDKRRRSA